ncbi:MAG: ornithine carbamoyltransferase [Nitriliruptoraceae bacterium]|nr:ornithine carbamoyltransferase [Nitriliruptoraceae bacterium]
MTTTASPRHFLGVDDLSSEQLLAVLDLAEELKADRAARFASRAEMARDELRGRTVALIFEKPSTRTRVSFQVAVSELGGQPLTLSSAELQLGRGETIADTGAVLSRYVHAIVVRTFGQDRLDELAANASVPVVNALTDLEHPCQALADLQTLRAEHGELTGRTLTYVGDGNNVAHSLLLAGAKLGLSVRVAHPAGYAPDATIVARAETHAAASGAQVTVTTDVEAAVTDADAVYTDVWASMGQEDEAEARLEVFAPYQVTPALMARAADDAIFLHCLPAHRGEEVGAEVIDGPSARVFDQAENRLHAQKALLATLLR